MKNLIKYILYWLITLYNIMFAKLTSRYYTRDALQFMGAQLGKHTQITSVRVTDPRCLETGEGVYLGYNCQLNAVGGIYIGDNTALAPNVVIHSGNHKYDKDSLPYSMELEAKKVSIGRHCWIGESVIILRGVTIGECSIIGAGAVVTKNIPPYSVAVGNPAKVIKSREINPDNLQNKNKWILLQILKNDDVTAK